MNVTVEKISSNKAKLTFDVEAARFDEAMHKAYLKLRGRVNIPGFRRGHAPRSLIENYYGAQLFQEEAFEMIFDEVYGPAIDENKVDVVDRPQIDIQQIGAGKDLKFTCEVFVKPDVTLGEYKGVVVKKEHTLVPEDEVDAEVERQRKKQAAEVKVEDRPARDGDTVKLDYAGSVDGVAFERGTAEGQSLKLGSHTFIPGFEEQVVGMSVGEEKDISVTFPEDYHVKDLAEKAAVFHVRVSEITETRLPELDDEFARDISEFDTLAEYKADIRQKLERQAEARDKEAFTEAVLKKVIGNAEVDIPQPMIERQIDAQVENFEARMRAQGLKEDDFLRYMGINKAQLRDRYRGQAESSVRAHLVLSAIEKQEGFAATDEEVDAEIAKMNTNTGKSTSDLKASLSESDLQYVRDDVIRGKCVKFLMDNAVEEGAAQESAGEQV